MKRKIIVPLIIMILSVIKITAQTADATNPEMGKLHSVFMEV